MYRIAAPSFGIEVVPSRIEYSAADIERAVATVPNGSMVVLPDNSPNVNRDRIITLAALNRLPVRTRKLDALR